MPASTTFFGVSKSGSPISKWTMLLPWRSRALARLRTSKAVSVPRRDMRSARRSSCWVAFSIVAGVIVYILHRGWPTVWRVAIHDKTLLAKIHSEREAGQGVRAKVTEQGGGGLFLISLL